MGKFLRGAWFGAKEKVVPIRVDKNTIRYQRVLVTDKEEDGGNDLEEVKTPLSTIPTGKTYPSWGGKMYQGRINPSGGGYDAYENEGYPVARSTYYQRPQTKKEKKFQFQSTRWSSYSFGSAFTYQSAEDVEEHLIVKAPDNYITPSSEQIRAKINVYNQDSVNIIKEACRVAYFKMIDQKDYLKEEMKSGKNLQISENEFLKRKKIYDIMLSDFIPGNTPLEQARAVYHRIKDEYSSSRTQSATSFNKRADRLVTFKRENYADADINTQLMKNPFSRKFDLDVLDNISLIGEFGSQFKVEKEIGETIVHNSDKRRQMMMTSLEQISMASISQRVLPNFKAKFIMKDLIIDAPVKSSEVKQKIIILLDYSRSMNLEEKQKWVNSILVDRFKYVMKGEAEVYFSYFISKPDQLHFTHIKNAEDVNEFWENFSNRPSGSMTDMGRIVTYVADEIQHKKRLHNLNIDLSQEKPEILIINDGQDHVGYDNFPYKVNAISLLEYSQELRKLCVASGGKQIRICPYKKIYTYTDEGKSELKRK